MGIMSNKHKTSVQGKQIATWSSRGSAVYNIKTGKLGKAENRQGLGRRKSSLRCFEGQLTNIGRYFRWVGTTAGQVHF